MKLVESLRNRIVEEEEGVVKSGNVVAGFTPIKSKKSFFAVLGERCLELHESEKSYRKGKPAKHIVDLSVAFNIHKDHLDPKLKQCICLMGPDDTLCLKADCPTVTLDWYQSIAQSMIPSRALKLGRPVAADEFFEYAWDVEVVKEPKLKRPIQNDDRLPNMCDKLDDLEPGPRRLCFYPHTIVLCKRRIEPTVVGASSSYPPFNNSQFIELQRMYVACFGSQERYFLIKLGRGSPSGECELWMLCESEEVASDIHLKLNYIIERESEKKKKINVGDALSNRSIMRNHRDRSHTQPTQMRSANGQRLCSPAASTSLIGRKSSGASMTGSLSARSQTMPQQTSSPAKSISSSNPNPIWSVFPPQRRSSNTSSILEEQGNYQEMNCVAKKMDSVSNNGSVNEETEDSGGTLRLENDEFEQETQKSLPLTGSTSTDRRSKDTSDQDSVGGISGVSLTSSSVEAPEDYAPMECTEWNYGSNNLLVPQYDRFHNIDEMKYISDSSDSCYSSMAANNCSSMTASTVANPNQPAPRAYSFGGQGLVGNMKPVPVAAVESGLANLKESTTNLVLPADDPRKRAFSLGSKVFLPRPFRKNTTYVNRQQRHSQTSASGVSLASSGGSSFGPSSSSSNQIAMAVEQEEIHRHRSGSIGSGRSTPYKKGDEQSGELPHVAMDFSSAGRSCSGSMASIDSPSRSRTSSFGCSRKEDFILTTAAEISIESFKQQLPSLTKGIKRDEEIEDQSSFEAPSFSGNSLAVYSPTEPYLPVDIRNSQVIETIEESASESSPSGSRASLEEEQKETNEKPVDDDYIMTENKEIKPKTIDVNHAIKEQKGMKVQPVNDHYAVKEKKGVKAKPVDDDYAIMEAPPKTANDKTQGTRPDRSASSPVRDVLAPPAGLPKRFSIPSMRSDCKDDSSLNYASLQIHDDPVKPGSVPNDSFLSSPSSRTRSKSGILFTAEGSSSSSDYASIKPT